MTEEEFKQVIEIDNSTQRLKHRENTWLEFKENFNRNDFAIYGKVLSSFANNCGELPVLEIRNAGFGNIVVVSFIFLCF